MTIWLTSDSGDVSRRKCTMCNKEIGGDFFGGAIDECQKCMNKRQDDEDEYKREEQQGLYNTDNEEFDKGEDRI